MNGLRRLKLQEKALRRVRMGGMSQKVGNFRTDSCQMQYQLEF